MDSNGKYLDRRRLWDLDGTKYVKTYRLDQVEEFIDKNTRYANLKYFMISVGCNDCDRQDANSVAEKLEALVEKIKSQYPLVKVIVGEITPRQDERDEIVQDANVLINRFVKASNNVFVIRNSNMRNRQYSFHEDNKHFARECIAKFASNIKHALRVAYGRKKYDPSGPNAQRTHAPPHESNWQFHSFHNANQQHQQQQQQQQPQNPLTQLILNILIVEINKLVIVKFNLLFKT